MSNRSPNRLLDDFARMMTDAAGAAQGVRREMEGFFRTQGERLVGQMDLVQREEFEAVREMAAKARMENEALKRRLADIEARTAAGRDGGGTAGTSTDAARGTEPPAAPGS